MTQFIEQSGEKQCQRTKRFLQFLRDLPMPDARPIVPKPTLRSRFVSQFREWRKLHRAKVALRKGGLR